MAWRCLSLGMGLGDRLGAGWWRRLGRRARRRGRGNAGAAPVSSGAASRTPWLLFGNVVSSGGPAGAEVECRRLRAAMTENWLRLSGWLVASSRQGTLNQGLGFNHGTGMGKAIIRWRDDGIFITIAECLTGIFPSSWGQATNGQTVHAQSSEAREMLPSPSTGAGKCLCCWPSCKSPDHQDCL